MTIAPWGRAAVCRTAAAVLQLRGAAEAGARMKLVAFVACKQHFWTALIVAASALSIRGVRRLELGENGHVPHTDIRGALKFCPQA